MCFKVTAAILSLLLFLTTSCGIHLSEEAPEQKAIQYKGEGYSCIGEIPAHFEKYINNELNDDQISAFTTCLQKSLRSFMSLTSDRHQNVYRPEDIRRFLQDYFLRKRIISDELLRQFMKIKQVLVGGSLETIKRPELMAAIELLDDIRRESINLHPYLPYLNSSLVEHQSENQLGSHLNQAYAALNHSIDVFASKLKNTKMAYRLSDLAEFMTEFRKFVNWEGHFTTAHTVGQWIELLKVFKEIAVSPEHPGVIPVEEWTPLLKYGARWYLAFLEYKVGVRSEGMTSGAGLQNILGLGGELLDLSADAVKRQPTQTVTFDQLKRLMASMRELGWIPSNVKVESLDQFFRAIITRMFGAKEVRAKCRVSNGLTLVNIDLMRSEFDRWATVQSALDHQFNPEQNGNLIGIQNSVPRLHIEDAPAPIGGAPATSTPGSNDWNDFIRIKEKLKRPLFANDLPRVMLVPESQINSADLNFGFYDLSAMNLMRSAVQIMFNGYAEDNKWFWTSGITGPEMQKFYEDIRDLGIDLGIIDQRNKTSGSRAFIEGKLFTYASQGLNLDASGIGGEMSAVETMTYLGFLYSGSSEATQIFTRLLKLCPHGPHDDINGVPKVDRKCALDNMVELMNQYMRNMPYLLQYLNQSSDETRRKYVETALASAFQPGISEDSFFEKNEMATVAVVIHYAEAVMTRYDVNQDNTLTSDEFEAAVPVFRGFIRKVAVEQASETPHGICDVAVVDNVTCFSVRSFVKFLLNDANAGGAFFYILANGQIPTVYDYLTIERYAWRRPKLALGRLELAQVFKAIIQNLLASSKNAPPPVIENNHCNDRP